MQVNLSPEPSQIRGGTLRIRIEGEFDGMDVKLIGGFKSGFSSGLLVTSPKDLGMIRNVSISWIPNSVMTLFYSERPLRSGCPRGADPMEGNVSVA